MEMCLYLGGIIFRLASKRELEIEPNILPFVKVSPDEADITITISWDWDRIKSTAEAEFSGQDALQNYYINDNERWCFTRGGPKGYVACTYYTTDFSEIKCAINEKPFLQTPHKLGSVLRFLPMRAIFQYFQVLFLHSAQIEVNKKGVLFTAPSGTGKTTQADLWVKYRKARLICNDRTLLHKENGEWLTFGYPIDGSTPVCSGEVNQLGCVVVLKQGRENRIERLKTVRAIALLMPQMVIDIWNEQAKLKAIEQLLALLREVPVYLFYCTPDYEAVTYLEQHLVLDGVIKNE